MSERITRNINFLKDLATSNAKKQRDLILQASEDNIDALSEIAFNTLRGNIKITDETRNDLSHHKTFIRQLSRKAISSSVKKRQLLKKRKILSLLITPLLSLLGTVAGRIISTNLNL